MRLLTVLLVTAIPALAQDAFLKRWEAVRSSQPAAVSFTISAPKTEYYLGEPILLRLSLTSTQPNQFRAFLGAPDRADFPGGTEEVLADPAALTEDPWHSFANGPFSGSILGGVVELSTRPVEYGMLLNDWIRFRQPGQYRVAVTTRRVGQIELASNILTLHIVAPPAGWAEAQMTEAANAGDRVLAGRILRSLDTPESAAALVKHLGDGTSIDALATKMALLASSHRQVLLPLLETRLTAPDQSVSQVFLDTLSGMADPRGQKRNEYAARLAASLPGKQPEARVVSMETLLNTSGQPNSAPAWLPAIAASLIADFRALPSRFERDLIEYRWSLIRSPSMLPVLRDIWQSAADQPLRDAAVRRIYDLAPDEGRAIILADLSNASGNLSFSTLTMLPDRTLPQLDEAFAARLASGQHMDDLILRYATGDIAQRAEQAYLRRNNPPGRQMPSCGSALVYYFLQHDPAFGEKELRRQTDLSGAPPVCYDIGFQFRTFSRTAYSPALEKVAIEFLSSPKVPVKRGAAEVLGKYGSAEAQKPLWETLEYFHSWWKDREKEMNEENLQFERSLRIALGQADGWVLQQDGLNRLRDLCGSDWCRRDIGEWLSQASSPVTIRIESDSNGVRASLAQYQVASAEELNRKIRQFPASTVFRVGQSTEAAEMVRSAGYAIAAQ